ncbi:MAG: alpha-L-fucosidase [Fimbriimonadaceae bacterium]|nr:alpha-L-fucosidase [Fimbriimonadaceae bacterium]
MTTLALAAALLVSPSVPASLPAETPAQKAKRMAWFKEARFGLFIHWGLYSTLEGEWKGSKGHAEWIRTTAHIPLKEYEKLLGDFNPVKFDPDAWCEMAKAAGMKYIVLTSKHHDGFCLFDSKLTDWDVMSTPYHKDIVKQLADACRRHGLKMCLYHSIMDWHHPDYLPRREWETDRPTQGADFSRFVKYLRGQVTEILTNYGDLGIVWFDGEWEPTWNHTYGQALYDLCRKLQPNVIVNNRVDVGRGGMGGMSDAKFAGDYGTPEQEVPAEGIPGVDWESCITMNDHWGYNREDKNFKSSRQLVEMLADIASKGGNLLLNIGPKPDGTWPQGSIDRMHDLAKWMKVNGDAIHGTEASPFGKVPFGRVTRNGDKLYLHVFDWPADGKLRLSGMDNRVASARVLGGGRVQVKTVEDSNDKTLVLPAKPGDSLLPVVELTVEGRLAVHHAPKLVVAEPGFVDKTTVKVTGSDPAVDHYLLFVEGQDGHTSAPYRVKPGQEITLTATGSVWGYGVGKQTDRITPTTRVSFRKLVEKPALAESPKEHGLFADVFDGDFSAVPDFSKLHFSSGSTVKAVDLASIGKRENVAVRFFGKLVAPVSGAFMFRLTSDDGSRLVIDGETVVDNDGLHGVVAKTGLVALAKGTHRIEVHYFNRTGGQELKLEWKVGQGKWEAVPATALWH